MNELYQSKGVCTIIYTTLYGEFRTGCGTPHKNSNETIQLMAFWCRVFDGSLIINFLGWTACPCGVALIDILDDRGIGSNANMIGDSHSAQYFGIDYQLHIIVNNRVFVMCLCDYHA